MLFVGKLIVRMSQQNTGTANPTNPSRNLNDQVGGFRRCLTCDADELMILRKRDRYLKNVLSKKREDGSDAMWPK
jgi:hypothetical protein